MTDLEIAQDNLQHAQAIVDNLKAKLEDKWKLPEYEDGSEWIVNSIANVSQSDSHSLTKAGRRRATKELAEICAKNSKQRDLLEAYAHHIDPEWRNKHKYALCIYFDIRDNKYYYDYDGVHRYIGTVYMDEDTAKQIVNALNEGELTL